MNGYVLDVTRLTSRLGRGALTGIDRVEAAYLGHLLAQDVPLYGLLRTGFGQVLLTKLGCSHLADLTAGRAQVPPLPKWAQIFARTKPRQSRLRVALALRRHMVAVRPTGLVAGIFGMIPKGSVYLNVGHSNLSLPVLRAAAQAGLRPAVLIHDTIPLDYPQFARAGSVQPFAEKIHATALWANKVVHISQDARAKTEGHFAKIGRVPPGIAAHLGVDMPRPTLLPAPISPMRPYFIALGTLEPRKNLKMLLDIWQGFGPDAPQLLIVGNKGWAEPALFDQIAQLQARGAVQHIENLPDGAVAHLLQGAIALLFPTFAEGFGLPPLEAAGLGTPVVAADLPVLRETCGAFPVYLAPTDSYSWMETIKTLSHTHSAGQTAGEAQALPQWADHFKAVLTQLS